MQSTTHYSLMKAEGTDTVNLLTQCYPNFDTIDAAMFANKQGSIGTATEVTTGTVHAITRNNADSDIFRFTATSAWTAGDTMTLDGGGVTVHLADGTTPATGAYIIGAEVLGIVNGSLVTLYLSSQIANYVSSFNTRTGAVIPASSDYDASMIDYDNTVSGLTSTDVQNAIDEVAALIPGGGGSTCTILWTNNAETSTFAARQIDLSSNDYDAIVVISRLSTSDDTSGTSCMIKKGKGGSLNIPSLASQGVRFYSRTISYVDDTHYLISDNGLCTIVNGTTPVTTDNNCNIPVVVYGIKM